MRVEEDVGIIRSTGKGFSTVGSMIERLRLRNGEGTLLTIGHREWGGGVGRGIPG